MSHADRHDEIDVLRLKYLVCRDICIRKPTAVVVVVVVLGQTRETFAVQQVCAMLPTARFRRVGLRHAPSPETSDTAFPLSRRSNAAPPAREPISPDSGRGLTVVCRFGPFDLFGHYIYIIILCYILCLHYTYIVCNVRVSSGDRRQRQTIILYCKKTLRAARV